MVTKAGTRQLYGNEIGLPFRAISWYVEHIDVIVAQYWNQTSVRFAYQTMSLRGQVMPLAGMWGIHMSGSNIGHHDIYMPHMLSNEPRREFGPFLGMWGVQLSW
ncbi:hypothetical protein AMECASPLE_038006 [Ameca splendens]|uniref:Uncharacterized protein n=1 Tax=Ameca splendens TaxID=208324 RepID=A0ABV0ZHA6_9TELE